MLDTIYCIVIERNYIFCLLYWASNYSKWTQSILVSVKLISTSITIHHKLQHTCKKYLLQFDWDKNGVVGWAGWLLRFVVRILPPRKVLLNWDQHNVLWQHLSKMKARLLWPANFSLPIKMKQFKSGTSAATYKLTSWWGPYWRTQTKVFEIQ